jgi:hypothetical protein
MQPKHRGLVVVTMYSTITLASGIGKTLMSRYKAALAERNRQVEGHRGLTSSLDTELVGRWEAVCTAWEEDAYPKSCENPYQTEATCKFTISSWKDMNLLLFIAMTEAEVRKEFAEDDKVRLSAGEESLHDISPSAFVFLGLELEDLQCVISFLLCALIF